MTFEVPRLRSRLRRWVCGLPSGGLSLALLRRDVWSSVLRCLCTSVGLGICPRGQGRFLMGFQELANKSTDSQFQFLDRDAWRQPWHRPCNFDYFSSRRKQGERERFQAVEFRVAPGSGFFWGWFRAALITRATDLRIIPPDLSMGWNLMHDM